MHAKAQGFGGLHVEEKADGAVLRLEWDVLQDSLFLDGCHRFLGGIIQVICCQDGQAALGQNPFSLVDVGPWKGAKKREEKQCYNRRQPTLQKWLNKGEPDLPSARMLKTTLCERRRVPLEESIHTDRWSHGSMVAHATADPNVVECEQRAKGQFVCARVCVSAPPAVVRSGVAGAGWYGDACAPSRPTTNQRERKRKTLGDTLCNPEALRTELAASQHCTPLGQMQAWQACHNTGQGAPQRTEGRRKGSGWEQERGSERGGGAGGAAEQKVKWSKIGPLQLKTTKASCLCGIYWFDTWRTKTESVWCAIKDSARCWNI